ncbi:MmpS family transport accessory protein [Mycobacterium sp. 050134]|uniref:MmpS family transport accessory protein n=1 Tax=Mycobacterium sp. 050134 TaxID=3096111 RepID=UPI003FA59407
MRTIRSRGRSGWRPRSLSSLAANIVARGNRDRLGCRITVNGIVREALLVMPHHAETTCLVRSE